MKRITSHRELEVYRKAFAVRCEYLKRDEGRCLYSTYEEILKILVDMITHADQWTLKKR